MRTTFTQERGSSRKNDLPIIESHHIIVKLTHCTASSQSMINFHQLFTELHKYLSSQTVLKGSDEAYETNIQILKTACYRMFLQVLKEKKDSLSELDYISAFHG